MLTGHMLRINVVGADAAWYNKFSPELKGIIGKAMDEAVALNNELTLKQEKDMLDELKKLGMVVVQPTSRPSARRPKAFRPSSRTSGAREPSNGSRR